MPPAVYLLAGQASPRWKVGDVLCSDAPQDRHQVRDSGVSAVSQQLCTHKVRLHFITQQDLDDKARASSAEVREKTTTYRLRQTDFKYLPELKNVYFVLVVSTETQHSMWPLVSLKHPNSAGI